MSEPLIDLQNIKLKRKNKKIEIYSLTIYPGVIYQIQGDNDSGKTLLMDVIAHERKQDSGKIIFKNKSSEKNEYSRSLAKKKISYLKEKSPFWKRKNVLQYLIDTLKAQKISSVNAYSEAMSILEKFDLKEYANISRGKLSFGIFRKIELLKILLENKELILLDEPYLKIDDKFITKFNYHIKNMIKENNKTIIISSAKSFSKYKIIKILFKIANGRIVKIDKPRSTKRKTYKK
ncbi:MAG: ATP-binding cassette domain-containing protein [Candidatus Marinimicrobia bacterium]|nr:ATP-binding cassette domain-containing protein [Candidatus Neomarinimicrobiota bacterium]